MLYLRACPRCHGEMYANRDMYGPYKECLQCGYMVDLETPNSLLSVSPARAKAKKEAA